MPNLIDSILSEGFVLPTIDRATPLWKTVSIVLKAVADHLDSSPQVRAHLKKLPKGRGTHCPDSPLDELVGYVSNQKGEIDKSDPSLTLAFMRHVMMPVFEFERTQVLTAIKMIDDLHPGEYELISKSAALARAVDLFWTRWFEAVAVPYQRLDAEAQETYKVSMKDHMALYDYTVPYRFRAGQVDRKSWAVAFFQEIITIADFLDDLIECTSDPALVSYFTALRAAYLCEEIEDLERVWTNVDLTYIRISTSSRIVPVHGIESKYEHPFGVSPEFRLEVRTPEFRDLIEERRMSAYQHALTLKMGSELERIYAEKLERTDVSVFVAALRAGVALNFRYAGQNTPNRQDVLAQGGRIFLDKAALPLRVKLYAEALRRNCVPESLDRALAYLDETTALVSIVAHEFAHPVARTTEIENVLNEDMILLEETKATHVGLQSELWVDDDAEKRLRLAIAMIGRVLRNTRTTQLENVTLAPYIRECLALATTLLKSGIVTLSEAGVVIDFEKARSDTWLREIEKLTSAIIAAYKTGDKGLLHLTAAAYCDRRNKPLASLIAWVNRK